METKPAIKRIVPAKFHASLKADKCEDYVRSQAINCETGAFNPEIAHAIASGWQYKYTDCLYRSMSIVEVASCSYQTLTFDGGWGCPCYESTSEVT